MVLIYYGKKMLCYLIVYNVCKYFKESVRDLSTNVHMSCLMLSFPLATFYVTKQTAERQCPCLK